jgi:GTP-binding protein EngB required for normal cell division
MSATTEERPGALEQYARLKLELAGTIRALLHLAERRKDELSTAECRRLLGRLAEDRFNLAFLGQFSRGKSSLMNALLGSEKLPTGLLPITSVITTVAYGESEKVLLQREGWSMPQEIRLEELPNYVTQQGNPGNEKRVTLAQVELPNELLRLGVHLIDTPGIASAVAANTRTTRQFLPEVDAAILVTSFESPLTEPEIDFLEEIRRHVRTVFVVVNKFDLVAPADREAVLASVRDTLKAAFPDADFDVFAVSAKNALLGKESGLETLERALTDFLRRDKARELLCRAAERTSSVARQQEAAVGISKRAGSAEEAPILEMRLKEVLGSLNAERRRAIRTIRNRLRVEFPKRCETEIRLWDAGSEALARSELLHWFSREEGIGDFTFRDFLRALSRLLFSEWRERNRDRIFQIFQELTLEDKIQVEDLSRGISRIPMALLGQERSEEFASVQSVQRRDLAFRELNPHLDRFKLPWWYDLLPPGRLTERAGRKWLKKLPDFARAYQDAVLPCLESAVDDWVEDLDCQLGQRIESMRSFVSTLLSPAPGADDLPEIEELLDRLHRFTATVLDMGTDSTSSAFPEAKARRPRRALRPCSICLRVERAVFDFLAHRQYELAVNESDQQRHALGAGFCPFHTWQYEAVASPQGVCSAYPPLLTLLAKRFRALAREGDSVQSLESGLRSLMPRGTNCPACQVVASTEKTAAREFTRNAAADVCAPHLACVLAAAPKLEVAKRLIIEGAKAFEILAEDMQNHVLKHEAVRHHLSTSAERQAAAAGLAQLAGRRDTARPRRVE